LAHSTIDVALKSRYENQALEFLDKATEVNEFDGDEAFFIVGPVSWRKELRKATATKTGPTV
jgi:hypothetical protein